MQKLVALVLIQVAAGVIGAAVGVERGSDTGIGAQCALGVIGALAWLAICVHDHAHQRRVAQAVANAARRPHTNDLTPENYHLDVVAVAYGDMDEADFERKWAGRVPPSPRRRTHPLSSYVQDYIWPVDIVPDHKTELFKEIMTDPQYAPDPSDKSFRDKVSADIKRILEDGKGSTPVWTCKLTLGLHEDGPCHCDEMPHRDPLFRVGQFVRWRGEGLWRVERAVKCYGPNNLKWWSYYVTNDTETKHPDEADLTHAVPAKMEWWSLRECSKPFETPEFDGTDRRHGLIESEPQIWSGDYTFSELAVLQERALCGCLVPVNFGTGKQRAFDPSKMPRVPGTGITYIMGTKKG